MTMFALAGANDNHGEYYVGPFRTWRLVVHGVKDDGFLAVRFQSPDRGPPVTLLGGQGEGMAPMMPNAARQTAPKGVDPSKKPLPSYLSVAK